MTGKQKREKYIRKLISRECKRAPTSSTWWSQTGRIIRYRRRHYWRAWEDVTTVCAQYIPEGVPASWMLLDPLPIVCWTPCKSSVHQLPPRYIRRRANAETLSPSSCTVWREPVPLEPKPLSSLASREQSASAPARAAFPFRRTVPASWSALGSCSRAAQGLPVFWSTTHLGLNFNVTAISCTDFKMLFAFKNKGI